MRSPHKKIPTQTKMVPSIDQVPIEYFEWGQYPDHFQIEPPHRHDFEEILFFIKGQGTHEIDHVNNTVLNNSIHFIPKSTVHCLKVESPKLGFTLAFKSSYLESNPYHRIVSPLDTDPFVLNLSEAKFDYILSLKRILLEQIKTNASFYKEKGFLISLELLLNSILGERRSRNSAGNLDDRITKAFKRLVRENIHAQTSVQWYAGQINISAKYLSNHVSEVMGVATKQYILTALCNSVKKSLINTDKSIKEIASDHNYAEASMCKLFKKRTGLTMGEFRNKDNMEF